MASSGGSGHGRERSNSGRKRKYEEQSDCGKNHKRIYLESRILKYFSRGFRQNLLLAMNLAATATSRLSCLPSKVSYVYITRMIYIL